MLPSRQDSKKHRPMSQISITWRRVVPQPLLPATSAPEDRLGRLLGPFETKTLQLPAVRPPGPEPVGLTERSPRSGRTAVPVELVFWPEFPWTGPQVGFA